jgi:isoamylase
MSSPGLTGTLPPRTRIWSISRPACADCESKHPVFRRRQFFGGTPAHHGGRDDLEWHRPDGSPMTSQDWASSYARAVTLALSGGAAEDADQDDPFLWPLNAWWEPVNFSVPDALRGLGWQTRDR